jgi:hypothetical protein
VIGSYYSAESPPPPTSPALDLTPSVGEESFFFAQAGHDSLAQFDQEDES